MKPAILFIILLLGCKERMGEWREFASRERWYQEELSKERRFSGRIYDKGVIKWIAKGADRKEWGIGERFKGVIRKEIEAELMYKRGEEYNRFIFETKRCSYDLYIADLWMEEELLEMLGGRLDRKVEIIGKIRKVKFRAGDREIEREEILPGKIRVEILE
jgi:hypothetical protein